MAKHLAQPVRRTLQHPRQAVRLAMSAGTAVLAVYAGGFHANGSALSSGQVPAPVPDNIAAESPPGPRAVASMVRESVSSTGAVSAPAEATLSFSRSGVLTGTNEGAQNLNVAPAWLRRPTVGTLMAPLEALAPSSPYGLRTSPITGSAGEFHWGMDFSAPCGTRVYAADAGVVRAVGWHFWGGGNRVELDHGNGLITTYNHLEGIAVKKGQPVQVGEIIAKVGTTGASTGCHLHFETILDGSHTDPGKWILLPMRRTDSVADVAMTDYLNTGATTDAPAWAVPVDHSHHHEVADGGHASPERTAATTRPSAPAGTSVAAPVPSRNPAPAPVIPKAPAPTAPPTPAPATSAAPPPPTAPAPVPSRNPAPAPVIPEAPAPTTVPAPAPAPVIVEAPAPTAVPIPAPAPVIVEAPASTAAPAPAPAAAPTATVVPAKAPAPLPNSAPALLPTPEPAMMPDPDPTAGPPVTESETLNPLP